MRTLGAMVWVVALTLTAVPVRADDAVPPDGPPPYPQAAGAVRLSGARSLNSSDTLTGGATGSVYVRFSAHAGGGAATPSFGDDFPYDRYPYLSWPYAYATPVSIVDVLYCSAPGNCDWGRSRSPADVAWTPDPLILGGTLVATIPSGRYEGGTLTVILQYIGVGAHDPAAWMERLGYADPEEGAALVGIAGLASIRRSTATVSGLYASSTTGSSDVVSGSGDVANWAAGLAYAGTF